MLRSHVKEILRTIRAVEPFNRVATSGARFFMSATGLRSDWLTKHLHRVGVVRSRLPNGQTLVLWSRGDDWIANQIYWRGLSAWEPDTAPILMQLAASARVTLDIGAHVGFYTLLAAHANRKGRVYAFEPLPAVYARLKRNVALNHLTNVHCIAGAVGEYNGTAEFFHVPAVEIPSSSGLSLEFMRAAGEIASITVPVVTIDEFVRENGLGRVDLVKVDTETTEPAVLRGMTQTIRRDRPNILCEVLYGHATERPLDEFLRPLGYRYYLLTPEGVFRRERIEGHRDHKNYLFSLLDPTDISRMASAAPTAWAAGKSMVRPIPSG